MTRPPVVLVGLDCPTGLQAARVFAARGVEVVGLAADPRHPCARTRSCASIIATPRDPDGIAFKLLELGALLGEPAVLVPCTDLAVMGVSAHREALAAHYLVAVPELDVTRKLLDKARFAEFAATHGFPIPATHVIHNVADLVAAANEVGYPCIIKPSIKSDRWPTSSLGKAALVATPGELCRTYDSYASHADVFVVQEWVPGGDTDHYTCDCYVSRDGEPLVTFCSRKIRQWPSGVGQGCLSVEHRGERVRETTLEVLRAAGHYGQGYVELKRHRRSGRLMVLEANVGRPTGRAAAAERAGVELLMTMYCDLLGIDLPSERTQHFRGTRWIHIRRDLQACATLLARRQISVREILSSWRGPLAFALFSWRDPVPFLTDVGHAARQGLGRRLRLGARAGSGQVLGNDPTPPSVERSYEGSGKGPSLPRARVVDFDVGGVLRVRTLDGGPADLAAVTRDLGAPATSLGGPPDIVVCFVDELAPPSAEPLAGGRLAPGDGGICCLDASGRSVALVRQGHAWGQALIVCRRGVSRVPWLAVALDLAAIARGWIPLHASAWVADEGMGVLAAGRAGSGKTGALLAACGHGAAPLGDDRVLLAVDGCSMVGLRSTVELRDWHLAQLTLPTVGPIRRALARTGTTLGALTRASAPSSGQRLSSWRAPAERVLAALRRRLATELALESVGRANGRVGRPDVVILMETHPEPPVTVERIDSASAAARLGAEVEAELAPALRDHRAFEAAFPGRGWTGVQGAPRMAAKLLREALRWKATYVVAHPPEDSLEQLNAAITRVLPIHARQDAAALRDGSRPVTARSSTRLPQ